MVSKSLTSAVCPAILGLPLCLSALSSSPWALHSSGSGADFASLWKPLLCLVALIFSLVTRIALVALSLMSLFSNFGTFESIFLLEMLLCPLVLPLRIEVLLFQGLSLAIIKRLKLASWRSALVYVWEAWKVLLKTWPPLFLAQILWTNLRYENRHLFLSKQ